MQKLLEKIIFSLIIMTWLSHLVQVFTPEVGFDAVWYHLPVIKAIVGQQKLVFLPNLYQSLNPLLSDLIFGLGFSLAGELGAKVVAYLFGLALVAASYMLSRNFLDKFWSLVVVLVISSFQVVAWQSASFYVDLAKAFWEISALVFLIKWQREDRQLWLIISALLFGASLATKLLSLFLLPVFLGLVFYWSHRRHKITQTLVFLIISLVLPAPFYIFAYLKTGQLFFSFSEHLGKLEEIGGHSSPLVYFWERTKSLIFLPTELIMARDYVSFILILFLPILFIYFKQLRTSKLLWGVAFFTIWQVLLWWYLPPLSTRYALAGFTVWTVVSIWGAAKLSLEKPTYYLPIMFSIFLAVMINLAPRAAVNLRSFKYLSGKQTHQQYIRQFFDGNIDQHLINWYQLD